MGSSPGNFAQLSYLDHFRGELYRDFADPIGISARALVEGLFGIHPDLLAGTLEIVPGFPTSWEYASMEHRDITVDFKRQGNIDRYIIEPAFQKEVKLLFRTKARRQDARITVNGKEISWHCNPKAVGQPEIAFSVDPADAYDIRIQWIGNKPAMASYDSIAIIHESFEVRRSSGEITDLRDPQHLLHETNLNKDRLSAEIRDNPGSHAFFLKMKQGKLEWWQPVDIELRPAEQLTVSKAQPPNKLRFAIQNNTQEVVDGSVHIIVGQDTLQQMLTIPARASSNSITVNSAGLLPGSNNVRVQLPNGECLEKIITNWKIDAVLL
ncbi:MAG TPA: hypothetical protein VK074_05625 [Fodinibius sp.]|nr:hypothetical protein [Fodinibius sp.]